MLRIKHFDANEKLQILYAKQLCERFSIQTFKNKFTGSESLVTLTSVCGDWVIRIDTLSFLKKIRGIFRIFYTRIFTAFIKMCLYRVVICIFDSRTV